MHKLRQARFLYPSDRIFYQSGWRTIARTDYNLSGIIWITFQNDDQMIPFHPKESLLSFRAQPRPPYHVRLFGIAGE